MSCLKCLECDKFQIGILTYKPDIDEPINDVVEEEPNPPAVEVEIIHDEDDEEKPAIDDAVLKKDVWVLVKFEGPKKNVTPFKYVCQIIEPLRVQGFQKYEKTSKQEFILCKNDICEIEKGDIIEILPEPERCIINRKMVFVFPAAVHVHEMSK